MGALAYVCLYLSYNKTFAPFSNEERGRIMTAMLNYASTGEIPQFEGNERYIWPTIQEQIDRDMSSYQEKCDRNRSNGAKGGRPPKNQTVNSETERFSEKPKKPKEKENENEKENEKEMDIYKADKPPKRTHFIPPTVDEVRTYCQENGYQIDPEYFVDYYTANDWMAGKNKMKDWKATVRNWNRREQEKNPPADKKKPTLHDLFPPVPTI